MGEIATVVGTGGSGVGGVTGSSPQAVPTPATARARIRAQILQVGAARKSVGPLSEKRSAGQASPGREARERREGIIKRKLAVDCVPRRDQAPGQQPALARFSEGSGASAARVTRNTPTDYVHRMNGITITVEVGAQ